MFQFKRKLINNPKECGANVYFWPFPRLFYTLQHENEQPIYHDTKHIIREFHYRFSHPKQDIPVVHRLWIICMHRNSTRLS
jgi:hypothetical protein